MIPALWPGVDKESAERRFSTDLGNLRSTLRTASGIAVADFVDLAAPGLYRADPDLIDCDVWRFEAALARSLGARDGTAVIAALEEASAAYGGDLAEGTYYEWIEPAREHLRRGAVDATSHLAALHEARGDLDLALGALEHAIRFDPYGEELYRRIMGLQARLGRPDAVRRTYRLLEHRLADIDADPDESTDAILRQALQGKAKRLERPVRR